jgi:hypothetical protein
MAHGQHWERHRGAVDILCDRVRDYSVKARRFRAEDSRQKNIGIVLSLIERYFYHFQSALVIISSGCQFSHEP